MAEHRRHAGGVADERAERGQRRQYRLQSGSHMARRPAASRSALVTALSRPKRKPRHRWRGPECFEALEEGAEAPVEPLSRDTLFHFVRLAQHIAATPDGLD